ncbi:MAG: SRPBCC family protein [Chloroflexota bacterium]
MQVIRKTTVNVSADKVWEILGDDFYNISNWSSLVADSHANPDLDSSEMGRVCQLEGGGQVVETVHKYDDANRSLAFYLTGDKIPFFMQEVDNTWSVTPLGPNQSELQVQVDATLMPVFKQLMTGMLSKGMAKQADGILDELKYFAENGHPKSASEQLATA